MQQNGIFSFSFQRHKPDESFNPFQLSFELLTMQKLFSWNFRNSLVDVFSFCYGCLTPACCSSSSMVKVVGVVKFKFNNLLILFCKVLLPLGLFSLSDRPFRLFHSKFTLHCGDLMMRCEEFAAVFAHFLHFS